MKVLLVDDIAAMRGLIKGFLKLCGYSVVEEAENGKQALLKIESEGDFDLIVTDLMMPTMNGFELVNLIRRQRRWDELLILVVSAETRKEDVMRAIQEGADAFIIKPFSVKTFREKIELLKSKRKGGI